LLILLVIVIVIFGTKKLKNVGTDLGAAVKGFKDGMKDGATDKPPEQLANNRSADVNTVDVDAKTKH